jgi:ParB family transcriptional regulator, chromosome partitioning protein
MKAKLSQIKINPVHDQIYSTNDIEDLVESMEKNGLLEPVVVTPDKIIISGHRRYLAAKFLEWDEIEIIIREVDKEDMEFAIVSSNQHRHKKSVEVLNEIQRLYQGYARHQATHHEPYTPPREQDAPATPKQMETWYW